MKNKNNSRNFKIITTEIFVFVISFILLFELFLSRSNIDFAIKLIILVLVLSSSFFLVKSVKREVKSRKEMEKLAMELSSMHKTLREMDRQKSKFVAISAHHLRTPLTTINGYASMALEGSFGELRGDEVKKAINRIFKSSERLAVIIGDFMDISKIESGEMDYIFSNINLEKITRDIIIEMTISVKIASLKISFNVDEREDYNIKVDEGKIRQVISNLLDNSIKYTPSGSIEVYLSKNNNRNIVLRISDTGIGMNEDTIKKIFHQFSRAEEASKFHTGGSGLGLYVAYEILKKHNARIWAESEGSGKGSTFYVEFKS